MEMDKPVFDSHQLSGTFLGHYLGLDLYFSPQGRRNSFVVRFGNAPGEYQSSHTSAFLDIAEGILDSAFVKALELAIEQGHLPTSTYFVGHSVSWFEVLEAAYLSGDYVQNMPRYNKHSSTASYEHQAAMEEYNYQYAAKHGITPEPPLPLNVFFFETQAEMLRHCDPRFCKEVVAVSKPHAESLLGGIEATRAFIAARRDGSLLENTTSGDNPQCG